MKMTTRDEANAIVAYAFRNTFLEELHAGKHSELLASSEFSRITDPEMKKLMIEACDKMEALLHLREKDPEEYGTTLVAYHRMYCSDWKG